MSQKPNVIELTSKKLKLQQALSILMLLSGLGILFATGAFSGGQQASSDSSVVHILGVAIAGIGLVWHVVVRFLIWWNHG